MTKMTSDTQAVLLLCSHFGKKPVLPPLTPTEYRKLAKVLWQHQKRPADLFDDPTLLGRVSAVTGIDLQRLHALMGRFDS